MSPVCILGGGPAGSTAAIAAARLGADVRLIERSRFPRHKVCGEFLSPGLEPVLERLDLWQGLQQLAPATIRRMSLHAGGVTKTSALPEPAYGLSRYALDAWLWSTAMDSGVEHVQSGAPNIVTTGRTSSKPRGGRLFGFKAHYRGPADDAVELYFSGRTYVGINCVEDGITNVCGLAPEEELQGVNFQVDALTERDPALRARLRPLQRSWDWIFTGPLEFSQRLNGSEQQYLAGDALSFVDPFTGSGLLCAILTGSMAGEAAAQGLAPTEYHRRCSAFLRQPFRISSVLRGLATTRFAAPLLRFAPARWIFHCTRPSLSPLLY